MYRFNMLLRAALASSLPFTGVLLLLNPTAEFKGGTGKHKVEGKEEAKRCV